MVSLAFIQFKSDRVYAVVSVEDILEFMPKHSDDFKKNKVYKVKWPYLKASSSFSEEDYHDANILCLGVNQEDIIQKAKSLKKYNKLPQSFLDECPSEKKNTLKTPAPSKKETTKFLKNREAIREEVAVRRMKASSMQPDSQDESDDEEIGFQKSSFKSSKPSKSSKSCKEKKTLPIESKEEKKNRLAKGLSVMLECTPDFYVEKDAPSTVKKKVTDDHDVNEWDDESENVLRSRMISKETQEDQKDPRSSQLSSTQSTSDVLSVSKKFTKSPLKSDLPPSKRLKQSPLKRLKEQSSINNAQPSPKRLKQSPMKPSFQIDDMEHDSDQNSGRGTASITKPDLSRDTASVSEENSADNSNAKKKLRFGSTSDSTKREVSEDSESDNYSSVSYTPSETQLKQYEKQVADLQEQLRQQKRKCKQLEEKFNEANALAQDLQKINLDLQRKLIRASSTHLEVSYAESFNSSTGKRDQSPDGKRNMSPDGKRDQSPDRMRDQSPGKLSLDEKWDLSPRKKPHKSPVKKLHKSPAKKPVKSPGHSKDFKSNVDLAESIRDAILDPESHNLREDSDGMIHLGNGVWVTKDLFNEKLSKLSVKNSIALADLMEAVWPRGALAVRSFDGGVSPKTPNAPRKSAATPAKKEVCLGFYRARRMAEGLKDKVALDMAVDYEGKKVMKDKFSRSGKAAAAAAKKKIN